MVTISDQAGNNLLKRKIEVVIAELWDLQLKIGQRPETTQIHELLTDALRAAQIVEKEINKN